MKEEISFEIKCKSVGDLIDALNEFVKANDLDLDTPMGWIDWSPGFGIWAEMMISYDSDMGEINIS